MLTDEQKLFLKIAAAASHQSELETGCPAELSLAQAIFESGWGARTKQNNCFGIKAHASVPGWQLLDTKEWLTSAEVARFLRGDPRRSALPVVPVQMSGLRKLHQCKDVFAAYETLADCFADHARIIQSGVYEDAWKAYESTRNLYDFIAGVSAHYATDPDYRQRITAMATSATVLGPLAALRTGSINA